MTTTKKKLSTRKMLLWGSRVLRATLVFVLVMPFATNVPTTTDRSLRRVQDAEVVPLAQKQSMQNLQERLDQGLQSLNHEISILRSLNEALQNEMVAIRQHKEQQHASKQTLNAVAVPSKVTTRHP